MENSGKIIWAAPQTIARDGIITLLSQEQGFTFEMTLSSKEEIEPTLSDLAGIDLLIIDNLFLDRNSTDIRKWKTAYPQLKVLVLSEIGEDKDILLLMKSGADGYILNEVNKDELVFAIKHVLAGNTYICTRLYLKVLERIAETDFGKQDQAVEFSPREEQILKLIIEGYSNQEIAYQLFTNKRTIVKYRENLLEKTGASDISAVIRIALQQGVLN
ncbi:LuxR C-terminal-related transcriptional regulator [Parapedobacter lycopersici]|uniref:LuxR C-terminal-related transcriptional regulator n=1 Tax=Parapedobacter lycopersici TaxID=1864939 RepID=UPI00214D8295|nr:response regulator transcription factor [Parapedobacter lycopersici]